MKGKILEVVIASGEKLANSSKCMQTQLIIQGVPIIVDLYILPLEGYDAVLGTQCCEHWNQFFWDFVKILMIFELDGKEATLQGTTILENQLLSVYQIEHMVKLKKTRFVLQILSNMSNH